MGNTSNESLAVGAVIGTFFPDGGQPIDEADIGRFHVFLNWQNLTVVALFRRPTALSRSECHTVRADPRTPGR